MTDTARRCARRCERSQKGFTLVELMVVVTIVGVLAAVAYPALESYIYKSRCAEATSFLGQIKLHQESFRSEFGQYVPFAANVGAITLVPNTPPTDGTAVPFVPPAGTEKVAWDQLGAKPDSLVRFGYGWAAGDPASSLSTGLGFDVNGPVFPDFWFVAQAVGDTNADGTSVTFEAYSHTTNVWVSNDRGWD